MDDFDLCDLFMLQDAMIYYKHYCGDYVSIEVELLQEKIRQEIAKRNI